MDVQNPILDVFMSGNSLQESTQNIDAGVRCPDLVATTPPPRAYGDTTPEWYY
jgi:hypothetical protein